MKNNIPMMQSVVAAICRGFEENDRITIVQLHGTGFYINEQGFLLTARHVIEKGEADVESNGGKLFFYPFDSGVGRQVCLPIESYEFAPGNFDVAICKTPLMSKTFYQFSNISVGPWKDVATHGYPAAIVNNLAGQFQIQQRYHKGYIQREVPAGRLRNQSNPPLFELSFPITQGLSGAPLFVYSEPCDYLIGVCVGTTVSQLVVYEDTQVDDEGGKYHERTVKCEEFGIAHDVRALASWKPDILGGATLGESIGVGDLSHTKHLDQFSAATQD